ncbi:ABC transporter substrate-binding protein [Bosea sp. Tri-44]|uniref:extracellular solute-binding protein n=1 Tax=Bosea sp. Tri-44 TaxID=1972137 RepID=UPI00100F7522|nr:extracellular solute-binding protein [Bosea sp. Tri-44]RXT52490.1 ABC transporter substrate-binding protein [Bosea sp. Tri-44]
MSHLTRRGVIAGASSFTALSAGGAFAQGAPASPVALNIIDVAGNLQLTQTAIEKFAKDNPKLISRLNFSRAPSPELPAKLKAQQDANRVDIDMVLTGPGAMSDGIQQGLWIDVWKSHTAALPKAEETYHEQALMMQRNFGQNEGVAVVYSPSGPLFEYAPDRLKTVPKTAEEFLAYVKQNKNRFTYARPLNSGPGWTFLQGLPYILGDSDPSDPMNGWAKSWAYLKELGTGIDYYPGGTTPTMKELGEGTRDVIVSTLGWDINPRALGIVPKEAKVFVLANTHWIPDTQFMCIPKGVAAAKIPVILALMSYMLKPEAQAATYDKGYFYPGPAIKGVTLAMAPQDSQDVIKEYGRPEYDGLIGSLPTRPPLTPERLVAAFRRWDQEIGVGHAPK